MDNSYSSLYLNKYYVNNGQPLHNIVNRILSKFGGINQEDYDDFYSIANEVFCDVLKRHDGKQKFGGLLYISLQNKIMSEMTRRNRQKRSPLKVVSEDGSVIEWIKDISLESPVGDNGLTVMDTLAVSASDFDIEKELNEENELFQNEKIQKYFDNLSGIEVKIVKMRMCGYSPHEIKTVLTLTDKDFDYHMKNLKSYENKKILYRDTDEGIRIIEEVEMNMNTITTTSEKTKDTSFSIEAICKKLKKHQLRDDHVLQRSSGQWNNLYKSELVSDILQGRALTQIIISEEIKNGVTMHWLIDGKQRCTNIDDFLNDGFAVSKNVQIYDIQYQTMKKDEEGNYVLNDDGFAIQEVQAFDIRKKKFSQLPEELQDKFKEYQVPVLLNLNCTKQEIAYDIARFNRCRPMNVAQNGWTGLDEDFAEYVDKVLKMKFFKQDNETSQYRNSNDKSGMMRRMIVESIIAINFKENFRKEFRKMCEYLSENANDSHFIDFYSLVERLQLISNSEVASMFNIKDSFLWFALFSKFSESKLPDNKFIDFMAQFKNTLHDKFVGGVTYDKLDLSSTKDRTIVIKKLNLLETLMNDYLHIEEETHEDLQIENEELKKYVEDFNNSDLVKICGVKGTDKSLISLQSLAMVCGEDKLSENDIADFIDGTSYTNEEIEDTLFYLAALNDWSVNVDSESPILKAENIPALLNVVKYAYDNDFDDDKSIEWFVRLSKSAYAGQAYSSKVEMLNKLSGSLKHHIDKANEKIA